METVKKDDVVVVMVRKKLRVGMYIGPAPIGPQHLVDLDGFGLKLVEPGDVYPLTRQPGAVS